MSHSERFGSLGAMARGTILTSYPTQDGRWATRWAKFRLARFNSDFSGDRKDDILFRHPSSGDVLLWIMNGTECTCANF